MQINLYANINMNKTRIPIYEDKLAKYNNELRTVKKTHGKVSLLRLVVFIAMLLSWFYVFTTISAAIGAVLSILLLVVFLILLKVHKKLEDRRAYFEALIKTNEKECASCNGEFTQFDSGSEFVDHEHSYSFDIDLFGKGSLFQYLNRTVTVKGKKLLSDWLQNTPLKNTLIKKHQKAVGELSDQLDFRQEFQVIGELYASKGEEEKQVATWVKSPMFFKRRLMTAVLLILMPLLSALSIVLVSVGNAPAALILYVFLINLTLIGFRFKQFNIFYQTLSDCHLVLKKIQQLVIYIEGLDCKSEHLINLKQKLQKKNTWSSEQIHQLTKLLNSLDNRNNLLLGAILNGFLLWDWQYLFRIEKWRMNHQLDFDNWLDCIANFDALISLANLYYNNPDFTFPEISKSEFEFRATKIGHPLLSNEVRVCNDFEIVSSPRYAIVTGANMAGKSTFLRTVATNIVLAGCGAPVCAQKLKFTPLPLHSSMRAEDSLMQGESYFFAELKRLQKITKALEKGEKLFIILDEILRGTNSEDKRKGSIGFVKKITEMQAHGLVATHDLELARLTEQQPEVFRALCFEVEIKNNELKFDYKLQPGVTQNMNASFLMKQMGII